MNKLTQWTAFAAASLAGTGAFAQALSTQTGAVNVERLARLDNPWGMTFLPDGRLLISEKPGRLRIFGENARPGLPA